MVKIGEIILWKPLYAVSILMLILFSIASLFNQVFGMIILFSIISLWSRLIPMAVPFAREIDVIDFFVLIIAINLGSIEAALFGVFNMAFSRIFGPFENIHYTIKDIIAYFIGAFALPFVYLYTQNLLLAIYFFVALRFIIRLIITLLFDRHCLGEEMAVILGSIPVAIVFNAVLVTLFGPLTLRMLSEGIKYTNDIIFLIIFILAIPTLVLIATKKDILNFK